MKVLGAVWTEALRLFLDDGRFAGAVLGWLALCRIFLPRLDLPWGVAAILLFAGLAGILAEGALRSARGGS
jgi:hypothetical protein